MNAEWLSECLKLDDSRGVILLQPPLTGPVYLLGMPVDVRDDGGVPHIEGTGP